ncbi:hypothetical protein FRC17_004297 [Serendipita sp. 399]|nr:hypothetical protein FRC17_004297 [Serendipita sp. 399]
MSRPRKKARNMSDRVTKIHITDDTTSSRLSLQKISAFKRMPVSMAGHFPTPCDNVNQLPNELLVEILMLHMKSSHIIRNVDLMLVCKRWRSLVAFTPHFWSRIEVAPDSWLEDIERCRHFVEICLVKSGSVPLDIVVDLGHLCDPKIRPNDCMAYKLWIALSLGYDDDQDAVDDFLASAVPKFNNAMDKLFSALFGSDHGHYSGEVREDMAIVATPNGVSPNGHHHIERWRSLKLTFAHWMSSVDISHILSSMNRPAPILETIDICRNYKEGSDSCGVEEALGNASFPALKTFSTNTGFDLPKFRHGRQSLQSLSLYIRLGSFRCLPLYENLRLLHLSVPETNTAFQAPVDSIILPHLHTLHLNGHCLDSFLVLIYAPQLRSLRLSSERLLNYPTSHLLERIHYLDWDIDPYSGYHDDNDDTSNDSNDDTSDDSNDNDNDDRCLLEQSLTSVLKQCQQLVKLTTWSAGRTSAFNWMRSVIDRALKYKPLASLKSVTYLDLADGDFDFADVQEVVHYGLFESTVV